MKLTGMSEAQLTEAASVITFLIQRYDADTDPGGLRKNYRDNVMTTLTFVLDDISQTRQGAGRPISELIKAFNRDFNPQGFRYTVVPGSLPYMFDGTPQHYEDRQKAMEAFAVLSVELNIGWLAVFDNQESRILGEIYL